MPIQRRACEQGPCFYFYLDSFLGCVYCEFAGLDPVGGLVGAKNGRKMRYL